MASYDNSSKIRHLGCHYFLKKSRKVKPECVCNVQNQEFMKKKTVKKKKKNRIMSKVDF